MSKPAGRLVLLPCLDSDAMATARRDELMVDRQRAAGLGHSALNIIRAGSYVNEIGKEVDLREQIRAAVDAKRSIPPDQALRPPSTPPFAETRVQISNETTLAAAHRLVEQGLRPLALNFANGVEPGGGFLNGARAQEEGLCWSSALFATLAGDPMYEAHRLRPRPDSSDWVIYSPDVPVFRGDGGRTLPDPWLLSVITCAAPYAPRIGQPESGDLLRRRIQRVLAVAHALGHTALVLGAWGCGAFGNDPWRTAQDFRHALEISFVGAFSDVLFAITDWSEQRRFLGPFREVFSAEHA